MIGYVTIEIQQSLLELARIKCVPTGKIRTRTDGEIEAEGICIEPGSNCETVWFIRSEVIHTQPLDITH